MGGKTTHTVLCHHCIFSIPLPIFFLYIFLASGGGSPLYPEFLQYYTMILQRTRDHCGRCRIRIRDLCLRKFFFLPKELISCCKFHVCTLYYRCKKNWCEIRKNVYSAENWTKPDIEIATSLSMIKH